MESVAAFVWNEWQLWRGISGRIPVESVAALAWNTHFEVLLDLIALCFDPRELLTQVTVVVAALLGLGFPLGTAVCDFAKLTHRLRSLTSLQDDRA